MSDLDQAKNLIARGEKEQAAALLAAILLRNRSEVEAWLLLGEIIDDPSKKRDCYNQALKLSPHSMFALTRLQELGEASQGGRQITGAEDEQKHHKSSSEERRQSPSHAPNRIFYTPDHDSRDGLEIIGYVVGGIAGFLLILYVIANASYSSDDNNTLCLGLIFLSLIVGIIILFVSNKNPG